MSLFKELEDVTIDQYENKDLPKWLYEPLLAVARNPDAYQGKDYLIEMLVSQVREYDIYADTGCCKWAFDHEDIKRTLRWLED